jgi:hypothetical protein
MYSCCRCAFWFTPPWGSGSLAGVRRGVGPPQVPGEGPGRIPLVGFAAVTGGLRGARSSAYETTDRTTKLASMGRVGASILLLGGLFWASLTTLGHSPGTGKYLLSAEELQT